jgi:hypothetical protein
MIRIHAVAGVEITAGESHLAERAQTLEFGGLIHLSSEKWSVREFPAKYGRLGRRCKPAAGPDVRGVTLASVTAGNLPLAF